MLDKQDSPLRSLKDPVSEVSRPGTNLRNKTTTADYNYKRHYIKKL